MKLLNLIIVAPLLLSFGDEGMIRLKDGNFLFAEVLSHDEAGILIRRLDTGGQITLRWNHLFPAEEDRLRIKYGYKDQSREEVRVQADRLRLNDGTERIGFLIDRSGEDLFLRIKETVIPVPKSKLVAPADRVEINALEVYTKDQLYEMKAAELSPTDATGFLDLGRFLVRIRDLKRALESFKKVQTLDAAFHAEEVTATVARLENQVARQEEIDALDAIDSLRGRREFSKALELCQAFLKKWPQSSFLNELTIKQKGIFREREELLNKTVVLRWYAAAERIAGKKGMDPTLGQADAQDYAQKEMSKEIQEKLVEEIKKINSEITPEQIRSIWTKRGKLASVHRATYGDGTFVLGAERAQKDCLGEKDKEKKQDRRSDEEKELQEKVRRYIENFQKAQKQGSGSTEEDGPDLWWEKARGSEKQQWILAYYAEFGGDMEVTRPICELCPSCGGAGAVTVLETSSGSDSGNQSGPRSRQFPCPSCHKMQIRRGVYYK